MWAQGRELPELDTICSMMFRLMTAQCERISLVNSVNGSKGGAPKGNKNAKTSETTQTSENNPNKPTVTESVAVTVSDTITVSKTAVTVMLTDAQRNALIDEFGITAFKAAFNKWLTWKESHKPKRADDFKGISKILNEDFKKQDTESNKSSFDVEKVWNNILEK
jgi:hypothetical protein